MDACHSKSDVGGGERCTSAGQKEEDGGEVPVQEILKEEEGERQQGNYLIKKEENVSPHDDSGEHVEREEEDELDEDDERDEDEDGYAYDDEEDRRKEIQELLADDRTDESLIKFLADLHRFKTDVSKKIIISIFSYVCIILANSFKKITRGYAWQTSHCSNGIVSL